MSVAYVIAHGTTALLITPVQARLLPEITTFASLVYLPHGVRLLATWLFGWKAVPPLFIGAFISEVWFSPGGWAAATSPVMLASILLGAVSAAIAFEIFRILGRNLYAGQDRQVNWKRVLLVGVVSSVLNSVGQSIIFSADIFTGGALTVLAAYAIGDIVGLIATALILMLVFRWIRLSARARRS